MAYGETDWTNNTEYLNFPGLRYYHLTHTDSSGGGGGGGNASVFKIHCDVTSESTFNYYENFDDILTAYNEGKMLQMIVGGGLLGTSLVSTSYVYTVDDSTNVNGFIFYFSTIVPFIGPLFYYFGILSDDEQHGVIEASTIPAIIPSDGIDYLDNSYIRVKNDSSVLNFLNDGRLTIKYDSSVMSVNSNGLSIKYDGTLKKTNSGIGVKYNNTLTNNNGLGVVLDSGDAIYVNNGLDVKIDGYTIGKNTNGYLHSCFYEDITYTKLVQKRDNGALVKGAQYRIVDYATTTSQVNTLVSGIGGDGGIENPEEYHQFDIIVTADSENALNENARAVWHDGDEYFALSNLAAWELKYCLDNDEDRFTWAYNKGKGVIYYMKDEFGNECPYDFKNIKFRMSSFKNADPLFLFDYDAPTYQIVRDFFLVLVKTSVNNDRHFYTEIKHISDFNGDAEYAYTFSRNIRGGDSTVVGDGLKCIAEMNIIKPTKINYITPSEPSMTLPSNVFIGDCYNNMIGDNCFLNTFNQCSSNKLSNSYGNIFMNKCSYNELNNSDCNTFGFECNRNKIEGGYYNILLSQCNDNILKNDCNTLICADRFTNNLIENGTNHVKFGFYGNNINQRPMHFYSFDFADGSVYYHQGGGRLQLEFLNACCSTGGNINTSRTNVIYYEGDPNDYYFYAMRFEPNTLRPTPLLQC